MPLNSRASGPSARSEKQESLRIVMRKVQSSLVCLLGLLTAVMSGQFHLHSIPDHSPLKVLLLRKCLRRIDKLKSFGIEKVRQMMVFPNKLVVLNILLTASSIL